MLRKTVLTIMCFCLVGCGPTKEEMAAYYNAINTSNQALIKSIEAQSQSNGAARAQQTDSFNKAMARAAITDSPTDDAVIAFAYGFQSATPFNVVTPNLQQVQAPETASQEIRAWTGIVGMALPFLYPWIYNSSGGGSGTRVQAGEGSTVLMDSANSGSYNRAGQNMTYELIQTDYAGVNAGDDVSNDCPGCKETPVDPCETNPEGLACPGCSCGSFLAGDCTCDIFE